MIRVLHYNVIPMNGVMDIGLTKEKLTEQHLLASLAVAHWHSRGLCKILPRAIGLSWAFRWVKSIVADAVNVLLWGSMEGQNSLSLVGTQVPPSWLETLEESATWLGWLVLDQIHHPQGGRELLQEPVHSIPLCQNVLVYTRAGDNGAYQLRTTLSTFILQ